MKGKRIKLASSLPPTVTIVPCVSSCPGDVYSRDSEEDINKFGLLPPCSGYMVRCIYPINLEIFMHEENFNLPIFNSEDFAQFVINENVKRERVLKPKTKSRNESTKFKANSPTVIENDAKADEVSEEISDQFQTSQSEQQPIEEELVPSSSLPSDARATDVRIFEGGVDIEPFDDNDELNEFVREIFQLGNNDLWENTFGRSNNEGSIKARRLLPLIEQIYEDDLEHQIYDQNNGDLNNKALDDKTRNQNSKYALTFDPKPITEIVADQIEEEVFKDANTTTLLESEDDVPKQTNFQAQSNETVKFKFPTRKKIWKSKTKYTDIVNDDEDSIQDDRKKLPVHKLDLRQNFNGKISPPKVMETTTEVNNNQFKENTIPTERPQTTKSLVNSKNVRTKIFRNILMKPLHLHTSSSLPNNNDDASETLKVGIDMESEDAKVMFVMRSKMKQMTVDRDKLVPALQILMDTLSLLEKEELENQ